MDQSGQVDAKTGRRAWPLRVGGVVVALAIIWGFTTFLDGGSNANDSNEASPVSAAYAQSACERFVKERLKAPATADFVDTTALRIPDTKAFRVVGSVDSENGFGAKIRTRYSCQTYYSDTDGLWHLTEVAFRDR